MTENPESSGSPLRKAIESHSRQLNLTRLIRERKKVRAIPMEVLERILCEAIANILLSGDFDPILDHESLKEQTRAELRRLMREHQEGRGFEGSGRAMLEKQVAQLKEELDRQQSELAAEQSMSPEEVQRREIEKLRLRIGKLDKALSASEDALQRLAAAKAGDPGLASIYDEIQGLSHDDAKYREKLEMIQVVFVNNLRLRNREVTADDLEGIDEQYLVGAPPEAGSPGGPAAKAEPAQKRGPRRKGLFFRKPVEPMTDETSF